MLGATFVVGVAGVGVIFMVVAALKGHLRHGLQGYPEEGVFLMALRPARPGSAWSKWFGQER
jgi:hypothetical protein